jgi:hypothetical protein
MEFKIETHAFLPSPFYKGQFQSLNGKVVSIEKGYVTEVAGKPVWGSGAMDTAAFQ